MDKDWRNMLTFMTVFLIVVLLIIFQPKISDTLNQESSNLDDIPENILIIDGEEIVDSFYETYEYHWPHMPVTYNVSTECNIKRVERIKKALDYIAERTEGYIQFEKDTSGEADISFNCINVQKDFTMGEAEIHTYPGTEVYSQSIVWLYYSSHCVGSRPITEIHEIMHLFGLEHAEENAWEDVMNPYALRCSAEISDEDVAWLKTIYG